MARRKQQLSGTAQYVKLEQRLVLLAWLNDLLGFESNRKLLADMKEAQEGFDASGHSFIYHRLEALGSRVKIPLEDLARYDDNIRGYLQAMNAQRPDPITLRYFQYLSVLYTEIFLDRYFNSRGRLLDVLNDFVATHNARKLPGEPMDPEFSERDLSKLAFWMATGSGKTLIMHINYRQFLRYNDKPLDNILLITPNEGLSEQHIEAMTESNIPCRRFDLGESGLEMYDKEAVRVIEITKLVEEKRGGGVSVPVEAFEGNNLIFVDEGHKGSGGEAWRKFRDALGETGFTFEYSATFGQALSAARNDELTAEYGKSIIFDYSYRYFYEDGYGKDFRILNLQDETTEEKTELLLLANLLSFYEQQRVFEEYFDELRPYNLEKPLWVFVGSSVNAVYSENNKKRSDVLTVARFFHHLLQNSNNWAVETIGKILDGKSGLVDPEGRDIFADRFTWLRHIFNTKKSIKAESIYGDILSKMFHTPSGGRLHLCDMQGHPGELGLKVGDAQEYFGLIYIGDTSAFKKLVENDDAGIVLEEDVINDSLFNSINEPDTTINLLIGAKKFMEGWNSWRVSSMCLLNIGRSEGSEIIQLFGRGVRLKGKDFSLKRSSALDSKHPEYIHILGTLNIFAIRANYMSKFRESLEREGVETDGYVELPLKIKSNEQFLKKGLIIPQIPKNRSYVDETGLVLDIDPDVRVYVDMSLKIQTFDSGAKKINENLAQAGKKTTIPKDNLEMIDWEKAYFDLLEYKEQKGFSNLVIPKDMPRKILYTKEPVRLYDLVADDTVIKPRSFGDIALLQETVQTILRRYVDKFYRIRQERWDSENMVYETIDEHHPNFQDYTIKISRKESKLIEDVWKLIEEGERIYQKETIELPNIYFDRHLYQPLLVQRGEKIKSEPPGLNESERRFVKDLRAYLKEESHQCLEGKELFLLRNLSRGKGVGFFDKRGFYPDFILWIKEASSQRVIFIEPHGMLHAESYANDDKARLYEFLRSLAQSIGIRTGTKNIKLDSFIVSATPYEELRTRYDDGTWDKDKFAEHHILFMNREEEYDYIGKILCDASEN